MFFVHLYILYTEHIVVQIVPHMAFSQNKKQNKLHIFWIVFCLRQASTLDIHIALYAGMEHSRLSTVTCIV